MSAFLATESNTYRQSTASSSADLLACAVEYTELLLRHWVLRGLHSGRVRDGVADLDLVGDDEAVYLLTRQRPDPASMHTLERRVGHMATVLDAHLAQPQPDDSFGCVLAELAVALDLSCLAVGVVSTMLAVASSRRLTRVMRFATGERPWSIGLLADLLAADPRHRACTASEVLDAVEGLSDYGLLELERGAGESVVEVGVRLSATWTRHALRDNAPPQLPMGDGWWTCGAQWSQRGLCVEASSLDQVRRALAQRASARRVVVLYGDERSCDTHEVGAALAAERAGACVHVDLRRWCELGAEAQREQLCAVRGVALLHRAAICLDHADVLTQLTPGSSAGLARQLVSWLEAERALQVWVLSRDRPAGLLAMLQAVDEIELATPRLETRLAYWSQLAGDLCDAIGEDFDARALLSTFQLSAAEMREVVWRLSACTRTSDRELDTRGIHEVAASVVPEPFGGLARRVSLEFERPDLKLPTESAAQFDELIAFARHGDADRALLGPRFKMSYGRAVAALFQGPPGTGKTMAAAVLARELGRALYQVNLAQLTSKWVGETEKNLERIFDEAQRAGSEAIVLLDEADSIASKRSGEVRGANDKHANNVTNFLLQRLEAFTGTIVMTTNNAAAMDPALMRRLQFKIKFPAPDTATRRALWARLLPAPLCDDDAELDELAEAWTLSGGTIKSALRRAAARVAARGGELDFEDLHDACVTELRQHGHLVRDAVVDEDVW